MLSTLSFVGPSRDGTNKLSPGDRGHYSCQFENQVNFSFILCASKQYTVQYTLLTCLLVLFFHGAELSFGIVNKCNQYCTLVQCTYLTVFPLFFANLRSAFLCVPFPRTMCKNIIIKILKTVIVTEDDIF